VADKLGGYFEGLIEAAKGADTMIKMAWIAAHGVSQGAVAAAFGGDFASTALSAGAAKGFNLGWDALDIPDHRFLEVLSSAVIGGTVSEIGGGKFANGAITAAFVTLFNKYGGAGIRERTLHHGLAAFGGVENPLAHKLLAHYMSGSGEEFVLSEDDVKLLDLGDEGLPILSEREINKLMAGEKVAVDVLVKGSAGAEGTGTLGQVLVRYQGVWQVTGKDNIVNFEGTKQILDHYDYEKRHGEGRSFWGKLRNWYGRTFIRGEGFPVRSEAIEIKE